METKKENTNWGLQEAVDFIKDNQQIKEIRKSELLFSKKIAETTSREQKADYIYYLLICKLKKHSVFETNQCKELYAELLRCFKDVEKESLKEYKKTKDMISKSQLNIFYMKVEHYLGNIGKTYKDHNFTSAMDRAFIDEMEFKKNNYKIKKKYTKFGALKMLELTSNYGTSMKRWLLTSLFVMLIFACLFFIVDVFHPEKLMIDLSGERGVFDYVYYSVVTFTTLGYGEITPLVFLGKLLAGFEVVVGYLMLGMLVNLLGRKN